MSRGGSKPGERRGGRQEGTPNKATVQKQLVAAQIAERTVADARTMGKKLAKEVLEDFMLHFADIAEQYRPSGAPKSALRRGKVQQVCCDCDGVCAIARAISEPDLQGRSNCPGAGERTIHRRCQAGQISHAGRDQGRASGSRSSAVEGHSGGRV